MLHKSIVLNAISVMAALTNEQNDNKNNKITVNDSKYSVNLKLICFGLLIVNFITAASYFYFKKSKVTIEVCDEENAAKEIVEKSIETLVETIDAFKESNKNASEVNTFRNKVAEFINALKEKKLFNISLIKKVNAAKVTTGDILYTHLETLKSLETQIQRVYGFAVNKEKDPSEIKRVLSFLVRLYKNEKDELDSTLNKLRKDDSVVIQIRAIGDSSLKRIKELVLKIYQIIEPDLTIDEKTEVLKDIDFEAKKNYLLVLSNSEANDNVEIKLYRNYGY